MTLEVFLCDFIVGKIHAPEAWLVLLRERLSPSLWGCRCGELGLIPAFFLCADLPAPLVLGLLLWPFCWGRVGRAGQVLRGLVFGSPRSLRRCLLNPGGALGGAGRVLCSLARPWAEALAGQWAGGPLETLEGCRSPGCGQPLKERALLTRGSWPGAFLLEPSLVWVLLEQGGGGHRPRERGFLSTRPGWGSRLRKGLGSLSFPFCRDEMKRVWPLARHMRSQRGREAWVPAAFTSG